jgi:ubiquinone/menaquinone biosynthesis C-methylase UbiE
MESALKEETEKLARSWLRHEAGLLRDYLVASVEDPRLNAQSVLSRHFLVRALTGERFSALMGQEYPFAAAMSWLTGLSERLHDFGELALVLDALRRGSDNAEGIEIPHFLLETFAALPAVAGALTVPNYIESFLSGTPPADSQAGLPQPSLDTFRLLWNRALVAESLFPQLSTFNPQPPSVLEPACGSANDYRFLHAYGVARLVNYTGFDLCATNIRTACALFPDVHFEVGNVFEIAAADKAFDLCFVHDLFEHLSPAGLQAAVKEVCRVTRSGLCLGFFNMDEVAEHDVRPVGEYHWNLLSMARVKEVFARYGFAAQVLHIGTLLRQQTGCEHTHNPNAYTFLLRPLAAPNDAKAG